MRKTILAGAALASALALTACSHKGSSAGVFAHARPDEFAVGRQAPLVIPPDFALNPPKPGAPRPQEADSSTQALQALFGGPAQRSPGEQAVIGQAGGTSGAAAGVRSSAGDPDTTVVDKGSTTRDIIAAPTGAGRDASVSTAPAAAPATTPR